MKWNFVHSPIKLWLIWWRSGISPSSNVRYQTRQSHLSIKLSSSEVHDKGDPFKSGHTGQLWASDVITTILQQCQENFFKVLGNSEAPWQPWQSTRAPPAAHLIKVITAYVPSLDRRPFLVRINQVKLSTQEHYKLEKLFQHTSLWSILVSSFIVAKDHLHK